MATNNRISHNVFRGVSILTFLFLCVLSLFPGGSWAEGENKQAPTLVPSSLVQDFLKGYSPSEIELIEADLSNIRTLCFRGILPPKDQKHYIATAGGPGAGKSTILENHMRDHLKNATTYTYLDPDQRALRFMIDTYLQETTTAKLAAASNLNTLLQNAYNKWRGGSNYIASTLLNEAFAQGMNIAHGTTSTSPHISKLYEGLKKKGYKITLLLCGSTDQNRVNALNHRAASQFFCQVDPIDVVKKGEMFPERFPDYFHYADELYLYWTDDFHKGAVLGGKLVKGKTPVTYNADALKKYEEYYEKNRKDKGLKSLDELIRNFSS